MRRRAIVLGALVLAVAAVIVVVPVLSRHDAPARAAAPALPTAVLHPPAVDLGALRGRPAVINFWASWCGPCRHEAGELERASRMLRGRARLVAVDWSDNAGDARAFVRAHGWTFPVLRDGDGEVGDRYGLHGLPTTFVLDASGRIVARLSGPQTAASIVRAVGRA
jgi:thiol-disulfide isomerase/thioredoxin